MTAQYLITYGSLLSRESRIHYSSIHGLATPVLLRGWKRSWCVRHLEEKATHAGAVRDESAQLSGALIPTDVTPELREREKYYKFTQINREELTALDPADSIPDGAIFWICEPKRMDLADADYPLLQSYADTCMVGCIEHKISGWGLRFVDETEGWESYWVDDRGDVPLYPRAASLSHAERSQVDRLLLEGGVLQHRLRLEDSEPPLEMVAVDRATHVFTYAPSNQAGPGKSDWRARLADHAIAFRGGEGPVDDGPSGIVAVPQVGFAVYGVLRELGPNDGGLRVDDSYQPVAVRGFCPQYCEYCNDAINHGEVDSDSTSVASGNMDPRTWVAGPPRRCVSTRTTPIIALAAIETVAEGETRKAAQIPSSGAIQGLVSFARAHGLPEKYQLALGSFATPGPDNRRSRKLLVVPTTSRGVGHANPIVQLSRRLERQIGSSAIVSYGNKSCLAIPQYRDQDPLLAGEHTAGLDETLRVRLGLPTREPRQELFTCCVSIAPGEGCKPPTQLMGPRNLILSLKSVHHVHSEKDVAVIDESLLELLGGESGDFLRLTSYTFEDDGRPIASLVSVRAMSAVGKQWEHWSPDEPYPMAGCIHIDAEYRAQLNLKAGSRAQFKREVDGYPILVSISVSHLIKKRALVYTFSLLGLFLPLSLFFVEWLGRDSLVRAFGLAGLVAFVTLMVVIRTEIRAKIK